MNKMQYLGICLWLMMVAGTAIADEPSAENELVGDLLGFSDEAPTAEELEDSEEMPLELDPITVSGQGLDFKQEVSLRIIRQAYNARRSDKEEDIDKLVCWLSRPTGSHFKHLSCGRNGDIRANRPAQDGRWGQSYGKAGYGKILHTTRSVNRWKLEQAMAALPGSSDFDREFLGMVLAGQEPPRDIPDDDELTQFASAWLQVGELDEAGKPEDEQVIAIEDNGLSLKRYNRIAELVETYQSVENQVDERINTLR